VRALLNALETNVKKYEETFGKIHTLDENQAKGIGFTSS
jgi:hypothetical protein